MLPKVVQPDQLVLGIGIITLALNLGNTWGPAIIGRLLDVTGNYSMVFGVLTAIVLMIIPIVLNLNRLQSLESNTSLERSLP